MSIERLDEYRRFRVLKFHMINSFECVKGGKVTGVVYILNTKILEESYLADKRLRVLCIAWIACFLVVQFPRRRAGSPLIGLCLYDT